jgi:DNA topoisomerase-1
MMMAQRLYENGFITYMRTDAVNLSADSVTMAKNWLTKELGSEYALETPRVFTGISSGRIIFVGRIASCAS